MMNDSISSPIKATCRDMALKSSLHSFTFSLKDFDIAGFLGDGAHGSVFLACERRTNFICVLKCRPQEALLRKEIELQAHLKHPHIACMYTWFHTSSHVFFVMEYCSNGDLFTYLNENGPFCEKKVAEMLFEIIWAIRTCHDKRIAHLDLKPENVLVNHEEKCKLADFGLSAHIGSKHKKKDIKRRKRIPENLIRQQPIWTLGILAFELKFGRPPFGSTNEERENQSKKKTNCRSLNSNPFIFIHNKNRSCIKSLRDTTLGVNKVQKLSHKGFNEHDGSLSNTHMGTPTNDIIKINS
ncbi:other/AUR protein kinase [Plasmodium falciparum RAJ116]|uniref:Other/AUR protein kinase n=1 Tax=Plasmodium falciparum RAJ116 TaxID=580058 RepID=A0A0L0CSP0_PLAFA|nr:other/AUR protein kinase [Plasmodium falciparum RAJ116]